MSVNIASSATRDSKQVIQDDADQASWSKHEVVAIDNIAKPDDRLIMAHDPHHPRCEKMRALRTELLLRNASADRANIIALLSPCAGEGRSLMAAELAITFAHTGRQTLLVDADLRRPQQHLLFGTDNRLGLSQAIKSGVKPLFHPVHGLPRMSVLTAGEVANNPLELLSSRSFALMIEDWRENFEYIVIDTAPVIHFSDGLVIASLVGSVLALSRAKHTPYKDMQDMLRRLAATRSQILGAVISHF